MAVKNRMDALEQRGVIEGYTVIVNPQRLGSAVSCYYEIETRPEALLRDVLDPLPGVVSIRTNVILSRVKDVKGLRL